MFKSLKAAIAAVLASLMSLYGIGEPSKPVVTPTPIPTSDPAEYEYMSDEEYYSTVFSPVLRFAVTSDTHILDDAPDCQVEKLEMFYDAAYAYSAAQEYDRLDAVLFAGDCTNWGSTEAMREFFRIAEENTREGTVIKAAMGNHEFYTRAADAPLRFMKASGYSSVDNDLVIGGYHFILLSPSSTGLGAHYEEDKQQWLSQTLEKAVAEDHGGTKPIFLITHIAPVGTVYTTDEEEAMHDLDDILCNYPQVVNFTGHTHSPANDPRSVWQGDYTVLNCGSMIYYGGGIAGLCDKYVYPTDHNGGCSILVPGNHTLDDAGDYYIVELDCRNAIKITGYSIYSDEAACTYYLRSVGDPAKFRYNENRVEMTQVPAFLETDELTLASLSPSAVRIRVPQTAYEPYTQHYRLELLNPAGECVDTAYVLSDRFYTPVPDELYGSFSGLTPETDYTVYCYAVSAYALESEPISIEFTTPALSLPELPDAPAVPDVFSMCLSDGGELCDRVSRTGLTVCGSIPAEDGCAVFDGSSYVKYEDFGDFYSRLEDGFSMEFFGSFSSFENSESYINMFSNFENGGIGFQCDPDGKVYFIAMLDGQYVYTEKARCQLNEMLHLLGTYDGQYLSFWMNGELVSRLETQGELCFTQYEQAQYLCVGGDSNTEGTADGRFSGAVAAANVYSFAIPDGDIPAQYAAYADSLGL